MVPSSSGWPASGLTRVWPDLAPLVVRSTTGRRRTPADLALVGPELVDDGLVEVAHIAHGERERSAGRRIGMPPPRYAEPSCPPTWRTSSPSHRARARDDRRDPDELARGGRRCPAAGLRRRAAGGGISCIAEIKRRSPSKGDLDPDLQPDLVAKEYVAGGPPACRC
jgi:hypothetical protein